MSNDFAWLGAAEIAALIRDRKVSALEVMQATLARAEKAQAALNCFITICADDALRDAKAADEAVARGDCERGIVFGGSGNGEAMTANRVRGIRCAVAWSEESARLSRAHNDANMLSIGQRLVAEAQLLPIVAVWLSTAFEGGRHLARIKKLAV